MFTQLYLMVLYFGVILIFLILFLKLKKVIRVNTNSGRHDSCRDFYKKLQILALPSQHIFSLLVFVNNNRNCFISNFEIHDIFTCHNHNLHLPSTILKLLQNEFFSGSKIFIQLPLNIKMLSKDAKRFNLH